MDSVNSNTVWSGQTNGAAATAAVGGVIAQAARTGDVVSLVGELGAGKTQLVRGMAEGLGIDPAVVSSPTFVLVHEYPPIHEASGGLTLVHVDAYRLDPREPGGALASIGWDAGDAGAELREGAVVAVEWADRLGEALGELPLRVTLEHVGERRRRITVAAAAGSVWHERTAKLRKELEAMSRRMGEKVRDGEGPSGTQALGLGNRECQPTACPICKGAVADGAEAATFPFCSSRCRQIDLGRWLKGDYVVSRPIEPADWDEA